MISKEKLKKFKEKNKIETGEENIVFCLECSHRLSDRCEKEIICYTTYLKPIYEYAKCKIRNENNSCPDYVLKNKEEIKEENKKDSVASLDLPMAMTIDNNDDEKKDNGDDGDENKIKGDEK